MATQSEKPETKQKLSVLVIRQNNKPIRRALISDVKQQLKGATGEKLFLVIESPGGDPAAAVRVTRLLQSSFKDITAIIPNMAMSAATLMSLGANRIAMLPDSCIGPLDLQIEHPSDRTPLSTLDIRDTVPTISNFVGVIAEQYFEMARDKFELSKTVSAKLAFQAAADLVKPVLERIDPYHLQSSYRNAQVGEKYAEGLLKSRMLKANPNHAELVAWYLTNRYSQHGYAISRDEARSVLGLQVVNLEDLTEWPSISSIVSRTEDVVEYKEIDHDGPIAKPAKEPKSG